MLRNIWTFFTSKSVEPVNAHDLVVRGYQAARDLVGKPEGDLILELVEALDRAITSSD